METVTSDYSHIILISMPTATRRVEWEQRIVAADTTGEGTSMNGVL